MQLTWIGLIEIVVGLYLLLTRRLEAMFAFVMVCSLMGGSAAMSLTAIGGATIAPGQLALGFLLLRLALHRDAESLLAPALRENVAMLIFAAYGLAAAVALPRIFRNAMQVVPMRPKGLEFLFDTVPLVPTSQNLTTSVYMAGTAVCCAMAFTSVREPQGATRFVKTAVLVTWLHAATGVLGVAGKGTFLDIVLAAFRNGSYAQLDQSASGFIRIAGILPEASVYAGYGFFWLALMTELWLQDIMARRTGPAAAVMALVLVASTSSTAYVALAAYGALLALRFIVFPGSLSGIKAAGLLGFGVTMLIAGCILILLNPRFAASLYSLLQHFTVDKMHGDSGQQRTFWARQGLNAFSVSYGLGIGPGSFRSSSLITAMIGSVGIIGTASFLFYCGQVLKPFSVKTYLGTGTPTQKVGIAAAWAAIAALVPLSVTNPSSDPGLVFGLFCGVALGLRYRPSQSAARPGPRSRHVGERSETLKGATAVDTA